jgi:hypothetical protein
MKISLNLIESNSAIQKEMLKALLPQISKYMDNGISIIKVQLPIIISSSITASPEYSSLLNGRLKYEFGIPNSSVKLTNLINAWINNIQYNYQRPSIVNNQIKSSFSANMIKADFSDVLYSDFAEVQDSFRGYSLPWLRWLLLEGNSIIIPNYTVIVGPNRASRTGFAVMKQSEKAWKVPSEFAGTESDNWITRSIKSSEKQIKTLLEGAFQ